METTMIFGSPITWLIAELFSLVLFFACMIHASKQPKAIQRILELFGFMIAGAIFENIGVYSKGYSYDLHRIMLIGKIPLDILLFEASILYAALVLIDHLGIPKWWRPLVLGLLGSVQDISLDPASIHELYRFDGGLSARWNWSFEYENDFFGIPFQNFSGWVWMIAFYMLFVTIGRDLFKKYKNPVIGYAYPFAAGLLTPVMLALFGMFLSFGMPFFPFKDRTGELVMLSINYAVPLVVMFIYRKRFKAINFFENRIAFVIPIALHLFNLVIALKTGDPKALIPVVSVCVVHFSYLYYLYYRSLKLAEQDIEDYY